MPTAPWLSADFGISLIYPVAISLEIARWGSSWGADYGRIELRTARVLVINQLVSAYFKYLALIAFRTFDESLLARIQGDL